MKSTCDRCGKSTNVVILTKQLGKREGICRACWKKRDDVEGFL